MRILSAVGNVRVGAGGSGRQRFVSGGGAGRSTNSMASAFRELAAGFRAREAQDDALDRIQTMQALDEHTFQMTNDLNEVVRETVPGSTDMLERARDVVDPKDDEFLSGVKPKLQPEVAAKMTKRRLNAAGKIMTIDQKQRDDFQKQSLDDKLLELSPGVADQPGTLESARLEFNQEVDRTELSPAAKAQQKRQKSIELGKTALKKEMLDQLTGNTRGVGRSVNPVRDANGLWQAPGLKYSMHGKRQLPLTKEYVKNTLGTLQAIDPSLGMNIVSGAQRQIDRSQPHSRRFINPKTGKKDRTGGTRHDEKGHGEGGTADFRITMNGRDIRPGENKALYGKAIKELAKIYPGMGHYSWGIHVGGGSSTFWGPNTHGHTNKEFNGDPFFLSMWKAGRSAQQNGIALDPKYSNIPMKDRVQIERQARSDAKILNKNRQVTEAQGRTADILDRTGNNHAAARKIARAQDSGTMLVAILADINQRQKEIAGDRAFNREENDELDLVARQEKADAVFKETGSLLEAHARIKENFKGEERKEIEKMVAKEYERKAKGDAQTLLADAVEIVDAAQKSTLNETDAQQFILDNVKDADKQVKALQVLQDRNSKKEAARKRVLSKEVAEITALLLSDGLDYPADVATAMDTLTGEKRKLVLANLDRHKLRAVAAEREQLTNIQSRLNRHLREGGTLHSGLESLSLDEQNAILGDSAAMNRLERSELTIAEGREFSRIGSIDDLNEIRKMDPEDLAAIEDTTPWKKVFNKSQYDKFVSLVNGAKDEMQDLSENSSLYVRGKSIIREFLPKTTGRGRRAARIKATPEEQVAANNEMVAFIKAKTDSGQKPTEIEMRNFAKELMQPVTSDPDDVNFLGFNPDVGSFEGIVANRTLMSVEQRDAARIDFDSISPEMLARIKDALKAAGNSNADENLIEQIAGQMMMLNFDRAGQLVRGQ